MEHRIPRGLIIVPAALAAALGAAITARPAAAAPTAPLPGGSAVLTRAPYLTGPHPDLGTSELGYEHAEHRRRPVRPPGQLPG